MKQSSFKMILAIAVVIFTISSCQKETSVPPLTPPPPQPFSFDLVADDWIKVCDPQYTHYGECSSDHQMYVDNFPDALSMSNLTCGCTIKVFLEIDNKEIQINGSPIIYMGKELVADVNLADIKLTYKSTSYGLPFSSLKIRVVGE